MKEKMEKNKLEIKHLAPYLPYRIKPLRIKYNNTVYTLEGLSGGWNVDLRSGMLVTQNVHVETFKPILRPLSDLYKPIKTGGIIPVEALYMKHKRKPPIELYADIKNGNYAHWKYEFLFENHFDVFGLIDKNLAIDLNTLPK